MSLKIKVCGLTQQENIQDILALNADYLGFILVNESKRFLEKDLLFTLLKDQTVSSKAILVVRDESLSNLSLLPLKNIKGLQLHGDPNFESPEYVKSLKNSYPNLVVSKAVGVTGPSSFTTLKNYMGFVDYFLFDTKLDSSSSSEHFGGTGTAFDHSLLSYYQEETPYFLSGGLSLENLQEVINISNKDPRLIGVDLNSKFELEPGLKDIKKLKIAFNIIRGSYGE